MSAENPPTVSCPRSEKEHARGDHIVWGIDERRNIGQYERGAGAGAGGMGKFVPKYRYDTVFGPEAGNRAVYEAVAQPLILPALEVGRGQE